MTLDEYFHTIINKPRIIEFKEPTMFDKTKMFFTQQIEKINSLLTKPTKFIEEPETLPMEDYWAFEIHTGEWVDEFNEVIPSKHDVIIKDNDSTWHEVLDQILDVMGEHYGYNIKEQVYYSVQFPLNAEGMSGHGRMLNDEVLQQLLLAHPEAYEAGTFTEPAKNVFA